MTEYIIWLSAAGGVPAAILRNCRPFVSRESAGIHARWIEHRLATLSGLGLRLEVRAGKEQT